MPSPVHIFRVEPKQFKLLEKSLREKLPTAGMIYNVLRLGQKLDESAKISVKIYADKTAEQWTGDTTTFMAVANVEGLPYNLVVFYGPKSGPSKDSILGLLSELDWKRPNQFEGVDNFIAPVLLEEARKRGTLEEHGPICLYYMNIDYALRILQNKEDQNSLSSSSLRISSLHPDDAEIVQDRWSVKLQGYLNMLRASIELCSSAGVYIKPASEKDSWELVSFAVQLPFGSIHALHTEPEHRRKGYGKLTMKVLAKNIAKEGRIPLVQIYKTNDNSLSLNEGVGFKYSHDINLILFTPN